MKKIRKNVFETNSSSTHSICIAKDMSIEVPKEIYFELGQFGWENSQLDSVHEKASYLYTGLVTNGRDLDFIKIINKLRDKGIIVTYEEQNEDNFYYVDHSYELKEFLDDVCYDENKLLNFLFSPFSFVLTGNDNSDCDVTINVSYDHDEYYKGN